MRFSIAGRTYNAADLDSISLKEIIKFDQQAADFGWDMTWAKVGQISERIDALKTDEEKLADPGVMAMTAVTVWASRRLAGEDVTVGEAVDFPMSGLALLPDPQDHKPKRNPTKARPVTRQGSARAAKRPTAEATDSVTTSPPTSNSASADA